MNIPRALALATLTCAGLAASAAELRSAGCKTEYFLIKALGDAIKAEGTSVQAGRSGNKKAIELLAAGEIDFAFTCQPHAALAKSAKVPAERSAGWSTVVIAKDPIVLVANPGCGVAGLTRAQVAAAFAGTSASWKDLGGADQAIRLAWLDDSVESGVVTVFQELTVGADKPFGAAAKRLPTPDALGNYAASVEGALVFMGMNSYRPEHGTLIAVDGVKPSRESVKAGTYPLAVTYHLVFDQGRAEAVKPFLAFAASPAGRAITDRLMVAAGP